MSNINTNLMWWLTVSTSVAIAVFTAIAFNSIEYIAKTDSTFISFSILILYFCTTIVLGYLIHTSKEVNFDRFWFISETMTDMGLIGTLVGLAMTFSIFVFGEGITDGNIKQVSQYIASGVGAAITTTLVGLICSRFLKIQLAILEKSNES